MWLPDIDVRAAGDHLVVHVPNVGDVSMEAAADALDAAPARHGFTCTKRAPSGA